MSQNISLCAGHRERLRQNFLDDKLPCYEVLELLLSYAIPRKDVRPLSRMLFKRFGGMYQILSASINELTSVPGMGKNTAIFIKVIQKIMLEGYKSELSERPVFHNKNLFDSYCKLMLGSSPIEEMHVLYLDINRKLLLDDTHSVGTTDWTAIHPREIIRKALDLQAKFVILVHNHPKNNTSFSTQDIEITNEIRALLQGVGIILDDHYVVSGGILYSLKESPFFK
ncbi:MAG: DNA repair protein RadC [Alphaproteobacteria bacterium]|nr:DNA repair protein RadC [Alphaproteobacteria bacterium]